MNLETFNRLISPLKRKLYLILGRAILTAIDNSKKTQKIQAKFLNGETISDIERFQPYGFETYPIPGSAEPFVGFINGNRNQGIVILIHDREYRPQDLSEGETAIYTDEDSTTEFRLWMKRARIAYMACDKFQLVADSEIGLGSATYASLRKLVDERFLTLFNSHVHAGVSSGLASTAVPTVPMTTSHMTDKVRGE